MDDVMTAANAVDSTAGLANPQATEAATQATTEPTAQAQTQTPTPTQQPDVTQTQAFARRLKEETQKAKDQLIAEIYGQYGITTYDQYQQLLEEQRAREQAQQYGVAPEFLNEFNSIKNELQALRLEREASSLANDPVHGGFFKQWENEIKTVAQEAGVSLRTAYTVVLENKLPDILNNIKTQGQQEAIQKITQNAQTSPGALSSEPAQEKKNIRNMSAKDIEELAMRVKRGEKIIL